jgi:hypothetical protein
MRHAWIFPVALLCALPASGDPVQLTKDMQHTLTPIDSLPTVEEIQRVFPQPNTVSQLATIATTNNNDNEFFGLRLRAIRALPLFCPASCASSPLHQTLVSLVAPNASEQTGKSVLLLRAVIEAIGATKSGTNDDVDLLVQYGLEHPVRDVRVATAFALRDLCNQRAVTPLRNRYNREMDATGVAQVRFAISEALRDLSTCTP